MLYLCPFEILKHTARYIWDRCRTRFWNSVKRDSYWLLFKTKCWRQSSTISYKNPKFSKDSTMWDTIMNSMIGYQIDIMFGWSSDWSTRGVIKQLSFCSNYNSNHNHNNFQHYIWLTWYPNFRHHISVVNAYLFCLHLSLLSLLAWCWQNYPLAPN